MTIQEKLQLDYEGLIAHGPITIVAFGDSVTHGAVAEGEFNYETVYWNRLRQKLNAVSPYVPVNVINAGIAGISAEASLGRLESQVLKHEPDLLIVCFGLNDVNGERDVYLASLKEIFEKVLARGIYTVFMTPNMLNTYVAEDAPPQHMEYAHRTAEMQNNGRMDDYITEAVALAERMGVTVCDCYAAWKRLAETEDTTLLLANRINHPTREMHELFAQMLFDTVVGNSTEKHAVDSSMYRGE